MKTNMSWFKTTKNNSQQSEAKHSNPSKTILKEYMESVDFLKKKYPIGSIQMVDGQRCVVEEIQDALPCTCFASYPTVLFRKIG